MVQNRKKWFITVIERYTFLETYKKQNNNNNSNKLTQEFYSSLFVYVLNADFMFFHINGIFQKLSGKKKINT